MCRSSVNTIYGRAMIGFIVVSKQNMMWYYGWVCRCRPSINTISGGIMDGFSLLLSVSKYNMQSCYELFIVVVRQ